MTPDVAITSDGSTWTATLSGISGLADQTATGSTPDEAADAVRVATQAACLLAAADQGLTVGAVQLAALELRLRQACSLAVASLTPAPLPAASGFGTDVSTFAGPGGNDLGPFMPLISGPRVLAEVVARRLLTQTGMLDYAPGEGFDTRELLGEGLTPNRLAALQAQMQVEASADERIQSADVTLAFNDKTGVLRIAVSITPAAGPAFQLVLNVGKLAHDLTVFA